MTDNEREYDPIVAAVPTTQVVGDLGKVDSHLAALYRQAAGAESAVPVVRALLANLVVYTASSDEAEEAALNVSEIAGSHPCRAIVVDTSPAHRDEPGAVVTTVCGITQRGDRRLCGEIIRIHPDQSIGPSIAGQVMPLLVADVPVLVWVAGPIPTGNDGFDELVRIADTLLVDSRTFTDTEMGFASLSGFCGERGGGCVVRDLAWTALEPWMELTAQHFDPPVAREHLGNLSEITVSYAPHASGEAVPISALLFVSWLIDRLQLRVAGVQRTQEGYEIEARQEDRQVRVRLAGVESQLDPGSLAAVTISGHDGRTSGTFVTSGVLSGELSINQECEGVCLPPQVLELPEQSPAALAARALDADTSSGAYAQALSLARRLLSEMK